jgi:hypothetical protein
MKNSKNLGGSSLISIPPPQKKINKKPKVMKQGVCHTVCDLAIYILKSILRQKEEELWKLKIFHHAKNIIFKTIL